MNGSGPTSRERCPAEFSHTWPRCPQTWPSSRLLRRIPTFEGLICRFGHCGGLRDPSVGACQLAVDGVARYGMPQGAQLAYSKRETSRDEQIREQIPRSQTYGEDDVCSQKASDGSPCHAVAIANATAHAGPENATRSTRRPSRISPRIALSRRWTFSMLTFWQPLLWGTVRTFYISRECESSAASKNDVEPRRRSAESSPSANWRRCCTVRTSPVEDCGQNQLPNQRANTEESNVW